MKNNLAYWRNVRGITQQQLADKLKIRRTYLSSIENGHNPLTLKQTFAVMEILNVTFDQIFFTKSVSNSDTKEVCN